MMFSLLFCLSLFRKYLRDGDRQVLAKKAFFLTVKVLEDNLNSLTGVGRRQPRRSFCISAMVAGFNSFCSFPGVGTVLQSASDPLRGGDDHH